MILPLQKRHRLIWSILAILLPIGCISAYWSICEIPINENTPKEVTSIGEKFNTREDDWFKIIERKSELNDSTLYQLSIEVKKSINQSATVVYISETDNIEQETAIGQLNSKGIYYFKIPDPLQTNDNLLFYNPITKEVFHVLGNE